ncbi:hypothetical protein NKI15_22285 [Mesorhizobium sp. M0862]|uniref:hypothetical protein n=1 Tax=Mesorhizobium sp. M0862 TaxID=2957015 RepID=UPI00333B5840
MPKKFRSITLLLPPGLTPGRYHALAEGLVGKLVNDPGIANAQEQMGTARSYQVLSELDHAPLEHVPVLNDSTWTLTLPVPADADLKDVSSTAKSLTDGEGVEVETAAAYRTTKRDS